MGKKIGLRGRSRTGKGVLEIGPNLGPLAAPWEPNLAPWEPFCEQFAHTSVCKLCSQPAQPSGGTIQVLERDPFCPGARQRPRSSQNYYTHGHPRAGVCGGTIELQGQCGTRGGELEIGPNFGPLPAPSLSLSSPSPSPFPSSFPLPPAPLYR